MAQQKFSEVGSKYGAPMGRTSTHDVQPGEKLGLFELQRVKLDQGGYDNGGAYWGSGGESLYWARAFVDYTGKEGRGGMVEWFFRASSRDAAKQAVQGLYPEARFRR